MLIPHYKVISESDRPFPIRMTATSPYMDLPVLHPFVGTNIKPVEIGFPPALPQKIRNKRTFIKQPTVKKRISETSRHLKLARAKAKARIRKIRLLAI